MRYINKYWELQIIDQTNKKSHLINDSIICTLKNTHSFLEEMRLLKYNDSKIITQLRTGHLYSNYYNYKCHWRQTECNNGMCNYCNQTYDTISHILYECESTQPARNILRSNLIALNNDFNNDNFFHNRNNLLYPHLHLNQIFTKHTPNQEKIEYRAKIITLVSEFVQLRPD